MQWWLFVILFVKKLLQDNKMFLNISLKDGLILNSNIGITAMRLYLLKATSRTMPGFVLPHPYFSLSFPSNKFFFSR